MGPEKWLLGLNLDERKGEPRGSKAKRAEKRLAGWREGAFQDEAHWQEFLRHQGLSDVEFFALLGEEGPHLAARFTQLPDWARELERIYAQPVRPGLAFTGFLKALHPLIAEFHFLLLEESRKLPHKNEAFVPETACGALLDSLLHKLRLLIPRVMILETNIARVEGRLSGETPEQRYENFVASLSDPQTALALLGEYPVLARQCYATCRNWQVASLEFLQHLASDFATLKSKFAQPDLGPLRRLEGNVGDAHKQGRAVLIAEFSNTTRLVYKPRPLAPDAAFQDFLSWFNQHSPALPLKTFAIWDCGDHGWAEYVPFLECKQESEIERFYVRQGQWLAVLYGLGVTDLHLENLIASGENPVVIDLETIFHPRLHQQHQTTADDVATEILGNSVATSGLLPSPLRFEGKMMDKSGMGATANQELPIEVDGFVGTGTDEVRVEKVPGRIGEVRNVPLLNGQAPDYRRYLPQVLRGFKSAYGILRNQRAELEKVFEPFRHLPIRVVVRATSTYSGYLKESLHPHRVRDGLAREQLFSQIWDFAKIIPLYMKICPSERQQLLAGDIPYFHTKISSRDLIGGDGSRCANLLVQSGWDGVMERLARLGDEDFARQVWQIEAAFVASDTNAGSLRKAHVPGNDDFQSAAQRVAERLQSSALQHNGLATWISLRFRLDGAGPEKGYYEPGVIETDLYSGLAGVSLFFAYHNLVAPHSPRQDLNEAIVATLEDRIRKLGPPPHLGAFSGLAGLVYLYTHLGVLTHQPKFLNQAAVWADTLGVQAESDVIHDVIAGAAGCIPVLLGLAQAFPKSGALVHARKFGEHLLRLTPQDLDARAVARGFSHGFSGMAWAAGKLAAKTGDTRFEKLMLDLLKRERPLLAGPVWSDVPDNPLQSAWCHGAHGIALSRLDLLADFPHPEIRADAERALKQALRTAPMANQILCHGSIGNLETLRRAIEVLPEKIEWQNAFDLEAKRVLAEINQKGWISPLPAHMMEPGLMKGLAGIGLGLLRVTAPDRIPSVLTLAPPL